MSPSPTDITFAQLAAFLPFGGSGLPSASPPPMLANAADGRFFPGPLAATAVARNGGTTAGAVPTKKSIKSRRVGSQLPLHERWTCPLKCGKFFKKSSSKSDAHTATRRSEEQERRACCARVKPSMRSV